MKDSKQGHGALNSGEIGTVLLRKVYGLNCQKLEYRIAG